MPLRERIDQRVEVECGQVEVLHLDVDPVGRVVLGGQEVIILSSADSSEIDKKDSFNESFKYATC